MQRDFEEIVYYATLAPSSHNTQPWKFSFEDNAIIIRPDYNRRLPVVDHDNHALFISLGCALENLIIAARHFGYGETVEYKFSSDADFIQVNLEKQNVKFKNGLFNQIEKRQVTRSRYSTQHISDYDLHELLAIGKENDVQIKVFPKNDFGSIIPFIEEANLAQLKNPAFKKELVSWIRFNEKTATATLDGLRSASMESLTIPTWFGKLYFNFFVSPEKETQKVIELAESSSLIFLFIAEKNEKEAWVKLGRSYERIALKATSLGIKHAHINMPCEEVTVRAKLKQKLGITTGEPLLLIRLGYAKALAKSYRREVTEVLMQ